MKLFDVVTLKEDIPSHGLVKGQSGTLIEPLSFRVWEVEFIDDLGKTICLLALNESQFDVQPEPR